MNWRWFSFLILTLVIGYGAEWAPYYVGLFYDSQIVVLGKLSHYESNCKKAEKSESICSNSYIVPNTALSKFREFGALGAGVIISATTYQCAEEPLSSGISFDDPDSPGRLFEMMSTYQTVSLARMNCRYGIEIDAWARPGAMRKGLIAGTMAVGTARAIDRVKRLTEFFTVDILLLLGFIFTALFALSQMLFGLLGGSLKNTPFERSLWAWVAFVVTCSGIVQILIPGTDTPLLLNRINAFFSLICHCAPILLLFASSPSVPNLLRRVSSVLISSSSETFPISPLAIAAGSAVVLPSFVHLLPIITLLFSILTIIGSALLGESLLLCYGLAFIASVLRLYSIPFSPAPYTAVVFVGFVVANNLIVRFRQGARLTQVVFWARNITNDSGTKPSLLAMLEELFRQVGAGRLTLLALTAGGGCRITSLTRSENGISNDTFLRDELPPLFAHAISGRQQLWHMAESDPTMTNIRRGQKARSNYKGRYLTVIPLLGESLPIGGIAFTDYPDTWITDAEKNLELATILRLMHPLLTEQIMSDEISHKSLVSDSIADIQHKISELKHNLSEVGAESTELIFEKLVQETCRRLKCYGFIAELDDDSREFQILGISGYPSEVAERLSNGRLFALPENEHGPLAMAVNKQQVIIVPDVNLLRGVLHENTILFFEKSGTRSCASVPIFKTTKDFIGAQSTRKVWGVLFLERNTEDPFTFQYARELSKLATTIDELIGNVNDRALLAKTQKALSFFVPERILNRVINQNIEREEDRGLFLMLDLKNSTKIALQVGSEKWLKNAQYLAPKIESIGSKHGFQLQIFNWDAFYLTKSASAPNRNDLIAAIRFIEEVTCTIDAWYNANYTHMGFGNTNKSQKARFCLTFGDTSRGFSSGKTKNWTIVGTEMPAMCKFEDVCKKINGVIFADSSLEPALDATQWKTTERRIPATNREIFMISWSWLQLLEKSENIASQVKQSAA